VTQLAAEFGPGSGGDDWLAEFCAESICTAAARTALRDHRDYCQTGFITKL